MEKTIETLEAAGQTLIEIMRTDPRRAKFWTRVHHGEVEIYRLPLDKSTPSELFEEMLFALASEECVRHVAECTHCSEGKTYIFNSEPWPDGKILTMKCPNCGTAHWYNPAFGWRAAPREISAAEAGYRKWSWRSIFSRIRHRRSET